MATITGTNDANILSGTGNADSIVALGGNDSINPGKAIGGTDAVNGGSGTDLLMVGAGGETESVSFNFYSGLVTSTSGNFSIQFTDIEKLYFIGGSGNDTFSITTTGGGHSVAPPVYMYIDGGLGVDTLTIGFGHWSEAIFFHLAPVGWGTTDSVYGHSASIRGIDQVTITGSDYDDTLQGGALADIIRGGAGDDTINAGFCSAGTDIVNGGTGIDTLWVRASTVAVAVTASLATVSSAAPFRVQATNMEKLDFEGGSRADQATGGSRDDTLRGNAGNDKLFGGGGSDFLDGGAGNDILDGGAGIVGDSMSGGAGNDTYIFDSIFDGIGTELAGGGTDRIMSSVSINFAIKNIEQFILLGSGNINCFGNDGPNKITGNSGKNVLNGDAHNDFLSGGGGADTLNGFSGNDTLDGGVGADTMSGGLGNDTVQVDNALDKVVEGLNEGTDTVITTVSYALGADAHVEVLRTPSSLTTTPPVTLIGNDFGQSIHGNAGANRISGRGGNDILFGHGGNDILNGGRGNDKLLGGSGNDTFLFNAPLVAGNGDIIADFFVPHDTIALENAVFTGLAVGTLAAAAFRVGLAAADASDRIVYNKATGALIFDSNGSASGGAVQFAKLAPNLALTNADFVVV